MCSYWPFKMCSYCPLSIPFFSFMLNYVTITCPDVFIQPTLFSLFSFMLYPITGKCPDVFILSTLYSFFPFLIYPFSIAFPDVLLIMHHANITTPVGYICLFHHTWFPSLCPLSSCHPLLLHYPPLILSSQLLSHFWVCLTFLVSSSHLPMFGQVICQKFTSNMRWRDVSE